MLPALGPARGPFRLFEKEVVVEIDAMRIVGVDEGTMLLQRREEWFDGDYAFRQAHGRWWKEGHLLRWQMGARVARGGGGHVRREEVQFGDCLVNMRVRLRGIWTNEWGSNYLFTVESCDLLTLFEAVMKEDTPLLRAEVVRWLEREHGEELEATRRSCGRSRAYRACTPEEMAVRRRGAQRHREMCEFRATMMSEAGASELMELLRRLEAWLYECEIRNIRAVVPCLLVDRDEGHCHYRDCPSATRRMPGIGEDRRGGAVSPVTGQKARDWVERPLHQKCLCRLRRAMAAVEDLSKPYY